MDKIGSLAKEWAVNYARHRHIMKAVEKEEQREDGIIIYSEGKKKLYIAEPVLKEPKNFEGEVFIITLNTEENLEFLVKKWKDFSEKKELTVIFINPLSHLETKWIIKPHLHQRICDESSLELGLKTMFEGVGPVNEKDMAEKF